jgi:hypothetical protein
VTAAGTTKIEAKILYDAITSLPLTLILEFANAFYLSLSV